MQREWCADHFPAFIPKNRRLPNSPDSCSFEYSLWNELGIGINWNRATTNVTLIEEIKRGVKRTEEEKFLNSVLDFTVRLRLIQKGGDYIR